MAPATVTQTAQHAGYSWGMSATQTSTQEAKAPNLFYHDQGSLSTLSPSVGRGAALAWRAGWASLTGTRHAAKGVGCEDSMAARALASGALYVALADGVSQGARGDVASIALAAHCIALPSGEPALPWLHHAEAHTQSALASVTAGKGAATLAAAWLGEGGEAVLTRVGDCRIYRWQADGRLHQERDDQSFANLGETPPLGVDPRNPARMVGLGRMQTTSNAPSGELGGFAYEVWQTQLSAGEGLLLCSDGVHDVLTAQDLQQLFQLALRDKRQQANPTEADLQHAAKAIAAHAQWLGSDDDIAVMLVRRVAL
jgi:serine/threonine protein phosphatase PrpC